MLNKATVNQTVRYKYTHYIILSQFISIKKSLQILFVTSIGPTKRLRAQADRLATKSLVLPKLCFQTDNYY